MTTVRAPQTGDNFGAKALELWPAINELLRLVNIPPQPPLESRDGVLSITLPKTTQIQNNSGGDLPALSILGISTSFFDPSANVVSFAQGAPVLGGVTPTVTDHAGRFAVLLQPIDNGAIGEVCISGLCAVGVNVTDEGHKFADVSDGDTTQLASGDTGAAAILWKPSGTGPLPCIVRIGNPSAVLPKGTKRYQLLVWDDPVSGGPGWGWGKVTSDADP